eukprot:4768753-Pyramimonas_sp.AAC.1
MPLVPPKGAPKTPLGPPKGAPKTARWIGWLCAHAADSETNICFCLLSVSFCLQEATEAHALVGLGPGRVPHAHQALVKPIFHARSIALLLGQRCVTSGGLLRWWRLILRCEHAV